MSEANGRTRDIERLRLLLDRLGASDITLAEAKALRESVLALVADHAPAPATAQAQAERAAPPRPREPVRLC